MAKGKKMSVNISKTNIMNLNGKMTASLNNQCFPVTQSQKDLGLIVNDSLNWTANCSKRCPKGLSALFQIKKNLSEKTHQNTELNMYNKHVAHIVLVVVGNLRLHVEGSF